MLLDADQAAEVSSGVCERKRPEPCLIRSEPVPSWSLTPLWPLLVLACSGFSGDAAESRLGMASEGSKGEEEDGGGGVMMGRCERARGRHCRL